MSASSNWGWQKQLTGPAPPRHSPSWSLLSQRQPISVTFVFASDIKPEKVLHIGVSQAMSNVSRRRSIPLGELSQDLRRIEEEADATQGSTHDSNPGVNILPQTLKLSCGHYFGSTKLSRKIRVSFHVISRHCITD
jgi:hypothetical protein